MANQLWCWTSKYTVWKAWQISVEHYQDVWGHNGLQWVRCYGVKQFSFRSGKKYRS